jgi:hypothetical protein
MRETSHVCFFFDVQNQVSEIQVSQNVDPPFFTLFPQSKADSEKVNGGGVPFFFG